MESTKEKFESAVDRLQAALDTHGDALVESLERGGLVPGPAATDGLIPEAFKPQTRLEVSYQGKAVDLGNFFRASECKTAPSLSFQREVSKFRGRGTRQARLSSPLGYLPCRGK